MFFGKNGSGKSRLLRAWRDRDPNGIHYVVPERSGAMTYNAKLFHSQLDGQQRRTESSRNYLSNYREQILSRIQGYFALRGGVEERRSPPSQLERLLATLLPDFVIELRGGKSPPFALYRATGGQVGDIDQLSSGEAQILTIGLDLLTMAAIWEIEKRDTRLMLVDEPDAHIHPDLQVRFADFLVAVATEFKLQIAIASHSTTLLAAIGQFAGADGGVVYLDRAHTDLKAQEFTKYLRELTACLGGHALMGPLFGVPLLLVEGDDDYRIWSQVPRHHQVTFAVIPCGGDEIDHFQKALEKLFESLRADKSRPAGFALLDRDKSLPQANADRPQSHVRFIRLSCHEAENLYLSDDVLALLGTDWTKAAAEIEAASARFGEKAAQLNTAAAWERKTADLKGLMPSLVEILDPKRVDWTIRVARAIGARRPQGQMLDYLGDEVVTSLWGAAPVAAAAASAPENVAAAPV